MRVRRGGEGAFFNIRFLFAYGHLPKTPGLLSRGKVLPVGSSSVWHSQSGVCVATPIL
jgi:hypothetical protein